MIVRFIRDVIKRLSPSFFFLICEHMSCLHFLSNEPDPDLISLNFPNTTALFGTFREEQPATDIVTDLPSCTISNARGGFLELYNVDTGFVPGRHGSFDNIGTGVPLTVTWNITAHPRLKKTHTGRYKCRTDIRNSHQSYQLNILGFGKGIRYLSF